MVDETEALPPAQGKSVRLRLVVVSGPDKGRQVVLERGGYRIGKSPGLELTLNDPAISRIHMMVDVLEGTVRVTDNGSRNGSFCDGLRFNTVEAKPGSVLRLGRTEIRVMPVDAANAALPASERTHFGRLVGASLPMRELFAVLERIAPTDTDLLIHGETGTGKELCAEAVHQASKRAGKPFEVCDLASVTPTLVESELFGHVKGAFTGATSHRAGVFERASGGTLFLDEVGVLPLDIQPRLLRALERREVKRVGGDEFRKVDVRVVAASNRDLREEGAAGRFREDLFHRLAVVTVDLPPLRARIEDIPLIVDDLLQRMGKPVEAISAQTRALLATHRWPGNVRELRNVVERAVSLGGAVQLPPSEDRGNRGMAVTADRPFKEVKDELVLAFERDYLVDLLKKSGGNVSAASRKAGLDRAYLHKLLQKHQIDAK
jgi:two-component system nitrogen regulation response regulator GlnG